MECHLNDLRQKHPGKWRAAPVHPLLGADVCLSFKVEMDYRVYSFARTVQILSWVWLVTRSWPQPVHVTVHVTLEPAMIFGQTPANERKHAVTRMASGFLAAKERRAAARLSGSNGA
jgi:hypothetical protein